jgi:hypothetical protein
MSFVNPGDSPIDGRYYLLKYYGLEDHPAIQQTNSLNALTSLTPDQVKQLSAAIVNNTQKAEADLKKTLTDFLKQPHQDNAEKILRSIIDNLHLMEIIKINDQTFPSVLTPLEKPTPQGFSQLFHPFHKITHLYLSLGDIGIDTKISYPRRYNSAPIIQLESFIRKANANLQIAYSSSKDKSELPLRRELAEALDGKLQVNSK